MAINLITLVYGADPTCIDPCSDTDGGINYYEQGTVLYDGESKTDSCVDCTGVCPPNDQNCVTCGTVVEYYCDNDDIGSQTYVCPNSCLDGACLISCYNNNQCSDDEFCELTHCAAETGQCIGVPDACPHDFDPVCGCDGNTYDNDCLRLKEKISKNHDGACENANLPPVIDGVGGPSQLDVNEVGTWSVTAHDPEGGYLSYSVDWGDNAPDSVKTDVAGSQTTTFTHSYSEAGSYAVKFTVTDDSGQSATTSLSVSIGGAPRCSLEGETCSGIANLQCCDGLACKLDGNYPDAGGVCQIPCSNTGDCPQINCIRAPCPEYTCVSGFCEKHTCGNGLCEFGETELNCPQDCACSDTDGGQNYFVKGTVSYGSEKKTDSCAYCTGDCEPDDQNCVVASGRTRH